MGSFKQLFYEKENKFTKEEEEFLKNYTWTEYREINEYLRNRNINDIYENNKIEQKIKKIDKIFNENILTVNKILYRSSRNKEIRIAIDYDKLKPGFEFIEKGYSSASEYKKYALEFSRYRKNPNIFVINAKKGNKILNIKNLSKYGKEEGEYLINRNTIFKIIKIENEKEKIKDTRGRINLEEIRYIYIDIIRG